MGLVGLGGAGWAQPVARNALTKTRAPSVHTEGGSKRKRTWVRGVGWVRHEPGEKQNRCLFSLLLKRIMTFDIVCFTFALPEEIAPIQTQLFRGDSLLTFHVSVVCWLCIYNSTTCQNIPGGLAGATAAAAAVPRPPPVKTVWVNTAPKPKEVQPSRES